MRSLLDLDGRRVTVQGLGLFGGGATAARFLARRGARVTVTDTRSAEDLAPAVESLAGVDVRFVLGEHRPEDFDAAELVVANPAVPPANPWLARARARGARVTSETELFLSVCPARIAAVTGTQGKSSTCNALHQLLGLAGFRAHLGGNIGHSLLEAAAGMGAEDVVVLELSSYQLEALPERPFEPGATPRVEVVCVTNVLADHLDRHGSLEAYASAKRRILDLVALPGGTAVLSAEDPRLAAWRRAGVSRLDAWPTRPSERGLNLRDGHFRLDRELLGHVEDVHLPGRFQLENVLLALGLARTLGAGPEALSAALPELTALPHRMQDLGLFGGHRVWDNGVSTTPDSTLAVFGSLAPGFTLIAGGKPKDLPLEPLVAAARGRARRAVTFGKGAEALRAALAAGGLEARAVETVHEAVEAAFAGLAPGEEVLFSPACASYDQYRNFEERARDFRQGLERYRTPAGDRRLDKPGRGG
ncbi:MAG: UDP-N-acetylmuramoyl-L-alanine--D-glutamate ligase [Planctomycetes bacterium]|nr:UDP-N-acetylmuramoyl-L-alanine--D-glutamate ligase [Planctomycetota bacterium]